MKKIPEIRPALSTIKSGRDSQGRFRPGSSGNPDGRPPKAESWSELFDSELSKMVNIIEGNDQIKVSAKRAVVKLLIKRALGEDLKAIKEILDRTIPVTGNQEEVVGLKEFAELLMQQGIGYTEEKRND